MAKRRFLFWLWIILGLAMALAGVVVVAALNSGVQTSVARHYLAQQDPQAKLEQVSVGLGGAEVRGLQMQAGGSGIKLQSATLRFSLWNAVFGPVRVIDDLKVTGLVLDASQAGQAAGAAGLAATPSSNAGGALPGILVKKASIAATVLLSGGRTANVTINGQNLGAGGTGQATADLDYHDNTPNAPVSAMHAEAVANLVCTPTMLPQSFEVSVNCTATVASQIAPAKLSAHLQTASPSGQEGNFSFALAQPGVDGAPATLLKVDGSYANDGTFHGDYTAALDRSEIAPFALGFALPDFNLKGQGQLAENPATGEFSVTAALAGTAGNLTAINPGLAWVGDLQWTADLDATWANGQLQGRKLAVALGPQSAPSAVTLDLLQPVTVDFTGKTAKLTEGAGPTIAQLTLHDAPAAWLLSALPANTLISGQGLNGQITLGTGAGDAIVANSNVPLTLAGVSLTQNGRTVLENSDLDLDVSATYQDGNVTAQVRQLLWRAEAVRAGGALLRTTSPNGKIMLAQFAGNVALTPSNAAARLRAGGRLAVAFDVDRLDQTALGENFASIAPAGRLTLDGNFSVVDTGAALEVDAFSASLKKGDAPTALLEILTQQKIAIPLNGGANGFWPAADGNLATITMNALPLALAQLFMPEGTKLSGTLTKGAVVVSGLGADQPGVAWRADEPLTASSLYYAKDGDSKLADVAVKIVPQGSWRPAGLKSSTRLELTASAGVLFEATLEADDANGNLTAGLTADGRFGALAQQPLAEEWRELLPDPKPQYDLTVKIAQNAEAFTVQSAEVRVTPYGGVGPPLAEARLAQPLVLKATPISGNAANGTAYAWPQTEGDAATVKLTDLPAGVLGLALPSYSMQGDDISADLALHGEGDGNFTLTASAPLTAANLTMAHTPRHLPPSPWLHDLTLSFTPTLTFDENGISYISTQGLSLSSGGQSIAAGNIEYTFAAGQSWPKEAKVDLVTDLAALLQQPVLHTSDNLAAGKFTLNGGIGEDGAFKFDADAAGWIIREPSAMLTDLAFTGVTGKINRDSRGNLAFQMNVPMKGQSETAATNCTLAFDLAPTMDGNQLTFGLNGDTLAADDLLMIQSVFSPPVPVPQRPPGAPPPSSSHASNAPDQTPFWGGWSAQAQIQLKHLLYQKHTVDDLVASAEVTPTRASLARLTGTLEGGAPLAANGTLAFDATQAQQPYDLSANLSLNNFDAGQYFKRENPNATPPVEGNFAMTGSAAGRGANLDDLQARVPFDFAMSSSNGTFHLLDLVQKKGGLGGAALTIGAGVANLAQGLLGARAPKPLNSGVQLLNQLLTMLDSFQYDQLVFEAQRGADANIKLKQFDVRNSLIDFTGTGQVTYVAGQPVSDQPLSATLQLNAGGQPAQLLQDVGLMRAGGGSGGYLPGPQFQVGGTLGHPDYGGLYNLLLQATVGGALRILGG